MPCNKNARRIRDIAVKVGLDPEEKKLNLAYVVGGRTLESDPDGKNWLAAAGGPGSGVYADAKRRFYTELQRKPTGGPSGKFDIPEELPEPTRPRLANACMLLNPIVWFRYIYALFQNGPLRGNLRGTENGLFLGGVFIFD